MSAVDATSLLDNEFYSDSSELFGLFSGFTYNCSHTTKCKGCIWLGHLENPPQLEQLPTISYQDWDLLEGLHQAIATFDYSKGCKCKIHSLYPGYR